MAKKRMVSNQIVDSDAFLDMPLSTQALYFHLLVRADDEGFSNNIKKVMRMVKASEDDLKVLIGKRFVIMFESGVLVIKHWLIHNTIRKDRLIETTHLDEKAQIEVKKNNAYTVKTAKESQKVIDDVQVTDTCPSSDRIDKYRLDKYRLDKYSTTTIVENEENEKTKKPIPYEEIVDYLNLKTKKRFKHTTNKTQKLIKARFNEGFVKEDFFKAIDNAFAFRMQRGEDLSNMKPSVIFNGKFEERANNTAYDWFYEKNPKKDFDITDY